MARPSSRSNRSSARPARRPRWIATLVAALLGAGLFAQNSAWAAPLTGSTTLLSSAMTGESVLVRAALNTSAAPAPSEIALVNECRDPGSSAKKPDAQSRTPIDAWTADGGGVAAGVAVSLIDRPAGSTCQVSLARKGATIKSSVTSYQVTALMRRLTVTVTGQGRVVSSPIGIDCPSTCSAAFAPATTVQLVATALPGNQFAGFGGACTGATCSVTLTADAAVSALFQPVAIPGNGIIEFGEDCDDANTTNGDGCSATGQTEPGYTCTSQPSICVGPVQLTVVVVGNGRVTSSPAGINCPSVCVSSYVFGTTVVLTAVAVPGSTFAGFTGGCTGFTCTVTLTSPRTVTATFV